MHVIDVAKITTLQAPPQLDDRGVELEGVAHHEDPILALSLADQDPGILRTGGERLLHQHMLSGPKSLKRELRMALRRARDDQRIDIVERGVQVRERAHSRKRRPDRVQVLLVAVDHGHLLHGRKAAQDPDVFRSPVATADDTDPGLGRGPRVQPFTSASKPPCGNQLCCLDLSLITFPP